MQVHIEDVSPVEKRLQVEIPWEAVRLKLDAAYKELGKGVQLRGFRKGKVPRSLLEKMFARQVQQEVAKELVQESFLAAAEEHKIEPVAEPVVEEASIKQGEAFRYSARIEVRSPIELQKWEGLEGTRRPVTVADEEVDHALEHKRMMHTEFKAIEGREQTAASDVVIVALKGKVGEFPIDKPEITLDLGDRQHEPLPGLIAALTGVSIKAQDLDIQLDIPADTPQKEIAGQKAELKATIRDARQKLVPALDDEFAKDTGEADTLGELRAKVRAELEKQRREQHEREARDQVLKALVGANPIPLAPALIERGIDSQLARARLSLAMQGIDMEKAGIDMSGMRDRLRDSAADEIRGQLLLEAIADREQLAVTDEELDARVAEMAAAQEKTPHKLKAELDKDGSLGSLRWRLRQEKALDLVVSRATITEAEPAPTPAPAPAEPVAEEEK
jgi:trigger factor